MGLFKLFTAGDKDAHKVAAIQVVATLSKAKVEAVAIDVNSITYRQNASPTGVSPALETEAGYIAGLSGVLRFLGEMGDRALVGRTAYERASIASMVEFAASQVESLIIPKPTPEHSGVINGVLSGFNAWLENKTFLCSERLSIADLALAFSLLPLYQTVLDAPARKAHTDLNRWMDTVLNQPQVKGLVKGDLCAKAPAWYKADAKPAVAVTGPLSAAAPAPAAKEGGKKEGKKDAKKEGKKDKEKKEAPAWKKEADAKKAPAGGELDGSAFDIRVGIVKEVRKHPDADSLYVEKIDVGEAEPREICSGLVAHLQPSDIDGKAVVVMCNLKPTKMRGITSSGMVMCSTSSDGKVALTVPPEGAAAGDKIILESLDQGGDKAQIPPKKLEGLLEGLHANDKGEVFWNDAAFTVKGKGAWKSVHNNAKVK
eukprot:TRINITY_DN35335_c0_g1_i1.p2 TRINITY_DN35335_c0_g1~~TRINITY_DN35335_c0_g1_i1.p2  ORF type:complete len:442 (+),score=207.57 TRINITY_DN35335_c0_g1_i1:45-1328(+)